MRVLLAGDVHGNGSHAGYLTSKAAAHGAQYVLQVGDFGYWEHWADGVKFLDGLNRYAARMGVTWVFIDGNHDKVSLLLARYTDTDADGFVKVRDRIRYAPRGHRWTWEGTRFLALGGAYSVDKANRLAREAKLRTSAARREQFRQAAGHPPKPVRDYAGHQWFPEEEMSDDDLRTILADSSPVDVIVAHDKPRATNPPLDTKTDPNCLQNQDRIQAAARLLRPKLLVHGHLHLRYTDWIRAGDGSWVRVEGLDCDPPEGVSRRAYTREGSWKLIDLPLVPAALDAP